MNKDILLIKLTVGKKHFKKWMKWLACVHGFEFQDVAPYNQYLCIDIENKCVWFCLHHIGILDIEEPFELYELMFDHFRVQDNLTILNKQRTDVIVPDLTADKDYIKAQINQTTPFDNELSKFNLCDGWYVLDINARGIYYDCIAHLIHCGFKDVSVPPFSTPPSTTALVVRLNVSITRKEFKLYYGYMGILTKEINSVTQLSNWLNVMINHPIFSRY